MERKNLIRSALTVIGRSGLFNRAASRRGIRLAPLLLVAVMLAAVAVLAETAYAHDLDPPRDHEHANVVCTVPPAVSCTYADVPGPRTLLSTTMTVGTRPNVGGQTVLGWDDLGRFTGASLTDQNFTFGGNTYEIERIQLGSNFLALEFDAANAGDIATQATRDKLTLHFGSDSFNLGEGVLSSGGLIILWSGTGLAWSANDSVQVKITDRPTPNAYGYRTIWTALMTAEEVTTPSVERGYYLGSLGKLSNTTIVNGRDETVVIGTEDQPRYPWTGYEIEQLTESTSSLTFAFGSNSYPSADDLAGWTLTLGGGVELPFANAQIAHASTPWIWQFSYVPGWTAGDQVVVSIRNDEMQNRIGEVKFKARRHTIRTSGGNIVYGKTHFSYDHEPNGGKFGPADGWELLRLNVTTDKTGDTDPVWISATFRTHGSGAAGRAWQGYWEGQFDGFPHAVPQVDLQRGRHRKGRSHLHAPAQISGQGRRHRLPRPVRRAPGQLLRHGRPRRHLHVGPHLQGAQRQTPGPGKPLRHERAHAGPATARHGETDRSG